MVDELKTGISEIQAGADDGRVAFLPEQQARVQELIDEAYRKAFAKAQRTKGGNDEVERLKSEVDRLKGERKTSALLRAVARHNVVDAGEVAELLSGRVKIEEDGSFRVLGESGSVRINSSGQPMSVEEFVSAWLEERPHHLRSAGPAGAGSQAARFTSGQGRHNLNDPAIWRGMPREDLDRLLKDGVDIQGSAGQTYRFRDVKNPFLEARRRKFGAAH